MIATRLVSLALALFGCLAAGCITTGNPAGRFKNRSWRVVTSPNFVIYTDGSPQIAEERLRALERFRTFCQAAALIETSDAGLPLRLIAPRRIGDYRALAARRGVAGYFRQTRYGPVAVFSLDDRGYIDALQVTLHEYVHHLMHRRGGLPAPLWYHEGMAEYLSAVEFEPSGHLVVGGQLPLRSAALDHGRWVDSAALFLAPQDVSLKQLYPQSWLLVHYLMSEHRDGLKTYLRAFRMRPTAEKFEDSFGFPLSALHDRLRAFWDRRQLKAMRFLLPDLPIETRVEPLARNERDYLLAHMAVGRLDVNGLRAMLADLRQVGLPHLALAEHLYDIGRRREALALVDQILGRRPDDARPLLLKAHILLQPGPAGELAPEAPTKQALDLALRANRKDPDSVEAFKLIAIAGLRLPTFGAQNVRFALVNALTLAPYRDDVLLLWARYLATHEAAAEARTAAELLVSRTTSPRMRAAASALLDELDPAVGAGPRD